LQSDPGFPGKLLAALGASAFVFLATAASAQAPGELALRVARLQEPQGRIVAGQPIAAADAIQKLYALNQFAPLWSNPANVKALQDAVAASWQDGLLPDDFHGRLIVAAAGQGQSPSDETDRDILSTDALLRLLYQLYFGKVSPNGLDADWNYQRPLLQGDPIPVISRALSEGTVKDLIARVGLQQPYYAGLKATLQTYTDYASKGGWQPVPPGPSLRPGASDPRVVQLRARLAVTGEYQPAQDALSENYDAALVLAARKFQRLHGIEDDGVLGPQSIKALNVTVDAVLDQIRVNMERARWVLRSTTGASDLVVVNIAGFYLSLHLDGKRVWTTDVIVGRPYHKTPVFTEKMQYVVLNPDWTVPASITRNEILPKAAANPAYLAEHNYDLVAANGERVPASSIDWSTVTAKSFPYSVVQRPGPDNALGLVKFIFPNRHNVYLHDTPSRSLFSKSGRAFSHGCIRVKDPLKLAEMILGNRAGWSRARIDEVIAKGQLQRVNLSKPLPVLILYWTVDPNFDGGTRFFEDIYGRDARLLQALDAPFQAPGSR
jgi:L,D-transpeptidase YcbB